MSTRTPPGNPGLSILKWKWAGVFFLSSALLYGGVRVLSALGGPVYAARWVAVASLGSGYLLVTLWRGLDLNRLKPEGSLLSGLGLGNWLSILRGLLVALLAGFVSIPQPQGWLAWAPGALYLAAVLLDFVDGYAARVTGQVTLLGQHLDISLDGLGLALGSLLAYQYGRLPAWYLPVGLARYLFLAGMRWRELRALPVYELDAQPGRRAMAGAQMGFVAAMLFPLFYPPETYLVAGVFMLPFLVGFWRDWRFVVTGEVVFASLGAKLRQMSIRRWLPLLLRVGAAGLLVSFVLRRLAGHPDQLALVIPSGGQEDAVWRVLLIAAEGLLAGGLLFGVAGRVAALAGMFLMGIFQIQSPLDAWQTLFLFASAGLFFLGTGAYSLWTPEDMLIRKRPGEA